MLTERPLPQPVMDPSTLLRILCESPEQHPRLAEVIADFIETLPEQSTLGLFGYGSITRALLARRGPSLYRHQVVILLTNPGDTVDLDGFPVRALDSLGDNPPSHVLILSRRFEHEILQSLSAFPGIQAFTLSQMLPLDRAEALALNLQQELSEHVHREAQRVLQELPEGRRRLVFLSPHPPQHMVKTMREACKLGYAVIAFVKEARFTATTSLADYQGKGVFHSLYEARRFDVALEFLELERWLRPHLIHGEVSMESPEALARIMESATTPVVLEYRDFPETVFRSQAEAIAARRTTEATFLREEAARGDVYRRAAGIIMKDAPETLDFMEARHGHRPQEVLSFCHYFSSEERASSPAPKLSDLDGEVHLVYAGGVVNDPGWHNYPLYHSLLEAGERLAQQRIHLTVINAGDGTGKGFEEYLHLAERCPYFHYRGALPYAELKHVLPAHDFGWFCFDFRRARENPFFLRTTMGSKVFTYLEAGLPVLISPEQSYMCKLVTEALGAGLPLAFDDLDGLGARLREIDWAPIHDNIRKAQSEWTYARHAPRLGEFYERVARR